MSTAAASSELSTLVGIRLRAARLEKGLTARDAARAAGLSVRFWSDLEAGRANVALSRLVAAAEAVGTTPAKLLAPARPSSSALERLQAVLAACEPAEVERCARVVEALVGGAGAPRVLALLGLRGAGKSTVGPLAAAALGRPFVELDERIEETAGLSLAEIFSLHGEGYYRRLAFRCLVDLLAADEPCVVALPGGIVHDAEAFDLVRRRCVTAWLVARPEEHVERVIAQGDRRPMAGRPDAMAELRALLDARRPLYGQADFSVDTSSSGPEKVAEIVVRAATRRGLAAAPDATPTSH